MRLRRVRGKEENGMKLIIAEKPSLARNIAAGIGKFNNRQGYMENSEYIITWV